MKKNILLIILSLCFTEILFSQIMPDPDLPGDEITWYRDADGDGYGNPTKTIQSSTKPAGYVFNGADCDDSNPNIGQEKFWFRDSDGDGFGTSLNKVLACTAPSGYVSNSSDCDDNNSSLPKYFYKDNDGDGYGISSSKVLGCSAPSGYVNNASDCNDSNASLPKYWYLDSDEDGYGAGVGILDCSKPALSGPNGPVVYSNTNGDCNDNNPNIKPGALEICDGVDNDCNGKIDEVPKPATPSTPIITKNCGNTVLTRGTPPSGITWYWQSNSSGTNTGNSNTSITRTSGTIYYLRARNNTTRCWSSARSVSYSINAVPNTPSTPTVTKNCGNTVLTRGTPPNGITWYWQSTSSGTSTGNSNTSVTRTSGTIYYLRARNNTSGCWSSVRSVSYSINTLPSIPSTPTITKNCGNTVLTKESSPSGITWYWQSSSSGTSTANSNTSITRTSGTVYYLRARNNTSGCWSNIRSVSYSINAVPSTPSTPTVTKNCGNTVLTRGTPPIGITWYWQSNSSGTSTGNSNTSITRTSGTVYYLRARNNTSGCWSSTKSVSYSINTIPSTPSTPTITKNCGNTVLTKGSSPNGITWYWQSSSSGTSTANSNTSITRTSGTVYYLRARNNTSGCWSSVRSITYSIDSPPIWYADTDGDGYGDTNNTTSACETPNGYVSNNNDYDDSTANITNIAPQTFYLDADGDGFGDPNNSVYYSVKPAGYVTNNTDNCPNQAGTNNGCSYTPPVFSNENYVFTREYQKPMTNPTGITQNKDVLESITYFDGLGRAKQHIVIQGGGLANNETPKDIVTHIEYDEFGRQTKEYLPYAVESANGAIITGDVATATKSYYQTKYSEDFTGVLLPDVNTYSEKQFEGSPLNRVLKQAAPGETWKLGNGHEIEFDYDTNTSTEVKNYYVTTSFADNTYTPILELSTVNNGNYAAGKLFKTITKDENHGGGTSKLHTTEEFKNKQGQVVLKRTYAIVTDRSSSVVKNHDTYYVYDDFGNLTYVLPPKAEAHSAKPDATELSELCYQYVYDHRNRLVEKKIPGKGWEYIIYDKLDRPVLTQDGNLRSVNNNSTVDDKKWLFTKYDPLGRVIYTGIYTHASVITREAMQTYFDSQNNSKEKSYEEKLTSTGTLGIYYSSSDFPNSSLDVLTVNYYDNYTFDRAGANTSVSNIYGVNSTGNLKSLATGSKVKVLDSSPAKWITTVTYYDKKARPIYVYSKNDELGTTDIVESKLDFSGKVLESKTTHTIGANAPIVTVDRFEYDHIDRLISQTQQINNQTSERIVKNNYDELGQLEAKLTGIGTKYGYKDVTSSISISDNVITKTGSTGWSHGLATSGSFQADGYVEFITESENHPTMVGLSKTNTNAHYNTIDYAIYMYWNKALHIYESGKHKGNYGSFKAGDIFRVERIGSEIHYKKNGETFYISQTPSSGALLGDISMYNTGAKIKDLKIVNNSKGLQKVDYAYNVRGWLKNINQDSNTTDNDLFNFTINYNNPQNGATALFNGNISETSWNTLNNDTSTRSYSYSYDALNRITAATSDAGGNYSVSGIQYDLNGNIKNLTRNGWQNSSTFENMDVLSYDYGNTNQLNYVTDGGNNNYGFIDGNKSGNDYEYDANGNMTIDRNKGITNITYNHLNLPVNVTLAGGTINYTYDASGNKLRKEIVNGAVTEYAGNYIYEKPASGIKTLQFFNHSEGYITPVDANDLTKGFTHIYQYKDHLGNVRLSYTDNNNDGVITPSTEIIEESNYYPFGLKHKGYNTVSSSIGNSVAQKLGFNGKELNEELGIQWYDFGARNYDAALGRWMNLDPLAEKYYDMSPYNYTANNPVYFIDPDGKQIDISYVYKKDKNGKDALDKNGNRILTGININITGKLINFSNNNINMEGALSEINSYLEKTFSGTFNGIEVKTTANFTSAETMEDVSDSDHLLVLAEPGKNNPDASGSVNSFGPGKTVFLDADYFTGWYDTNFGETGERTATHELGHSFGLKHPKKNWGDRNNIMTSGGKGNLFTFSQLGTIIKNYDESNQALNHNANGLPSLGVLQGSGIFYMTNTKGRNKKVNKVEYFKKQMKLKK